MLIQLFRFESCYHARQLSFRAAAPMFAALGVLAIYGNYGGPGVHVNGPYVITMLTGLLSLTVIFASILFCANVVLRDITHRTEAFIFTSPLSRPVYFFSRFGALLLMVFVLLCIASLGMAAGTGLAMPSRRGAFQGIYYLQPLLVFGLPNVLFSCSVVFAAALLTRSARAVYAAGVLLYVLYLLGSIFGNSPILANSGAGDASLAALLDPFGLSAFFAEARGWTDAQRNGLLMPLQGAFLLNRILWTGFSLLLLAGTYKIFSSRPQLLRSRQTMPHQETVTRAFYRPVAPVFKGYFSHASWRMLKLEAAAMLRNIPLAAMLLLWVVLMGVELNDALFHGMFGLSLYPATGIIVEELYGVKPGMLLIIFCAAEVIKRERAVNIHMLIYAAPVRNLLFILVPCAVAGLIAFILVSLNILLGLGIQWSHGYYQADISVYALLYYYSGLPLLLFAMLAVGVQTLMPHKYTGMLANLLLAGFVLFGKHFGLKNPLWHLTLPPPLQYSDMNGFGHYAKAFDWYAVYWAGTSLALLCFAAMWWQWKRRAAGRPGIWAIPCLLLSLITGIYIFSEQVHEDPERWAEEYEKKFLQYASLAQPTITAVRTETDIYPREGRYTVKGMYRLENRTGKTIMRLLGGAHPEVSQLQFKGKAHPAGLHQYWIDLPAPLAPGDTMRLEFRMAADRNSFRDFNNEHSIVRNGTYVELEKYLPYIGFNAGLLLDDSSRRKTFGLPAVLPQGPASVPRPVAFETIISTEEGQEAVTTGTLLKDWAKDGRHYFHYKTQAPIQPMFAFSSARYKERQETHKGVDLRLHYHAGDEANVPAIMQGMKDAIDYCQAQFGPYPFPGCTLAELPQYRGAATAYPGLLFAGEKVVFKGDYKYGKINFAYATIAHEVSHQWWAMQLAPADTTGSKFLTESLAKYTEAMVVEKRYGKRYLRQYLLADNRWYMYARQFGGQEQALAYTDGTPHVAYQKGGLALYRLKETLGEERVNAALRRALSAKVSRAEALVAELSAGATTEEAALIHSCLQEIVTYDLAVKVISCEPQNGRFRLRLQIGTLRNGGPAADLLPLGVYASPSPGDKPIYEKMHRFHTKDTTLTLMLDRQPVTVAIDPYGYIPDAVLQDNVATVQTADPPMQNPGVSIANIK